MFEVPPNRLQKKWIPSAKPISPEKKAEKMKEIKEGEEKEKQKNENIAETLLNELELMGIKCQRCGSKNVKENKQLSDKDSENLHLHCLDCNYEWAEPK